MSPAGDGPAAVRVDPEVGGTGIWDHGELLWWGSDLDINEVLGVHVVLDIDVLAGKEFLLNSVVLTGDHILGEVLLVKCDFTSRGRTDTVWPGDTVVYALAFYCASAV